MTTILLCCYERCVVSHLLYKGTHMHIWICSSTTVTIHSLNNLLISTPHHSTRIHLTKVHYRFVSLEPIYIFILNPYHDITAILHSDPYNRISIAQEELHGRLVIVKSVIASTTHSGECMDSTIYPVRYIHNYVVVFCSSNLLGLIDSMCLPTHIPQGAVTALRQSCEQIVSMILGSCISRYLTLILSKKAYLQFVYSHVTKRTVLLILLPWFFDWIKMIHNFNSCDFRFILFCYLILFVNFYIVVIFTRYCCRRRGPVCWQHCCRSY